MRRILFWIMFSIVLLVAMVLIYHFTYNPDPVMYDLVDKEYYDVVEIDSYEEYINYFDLHEDYDFTKELKSEDFNNKKYLFFDIIIDTCSETVVKDELVYTGKKYVLNIDYNKKCGVCAPVHKVYIYEIENKYKDILFYSRVITTSSCNENVTYKPIMYIYPTEDMDLTIKLVNEENLLHTYPKYKGSWNVKVSTNSNIYDYETKRNYYALYWDEVDNYKMNYKVGFVVKGEDTAKFLEEKLEILGLNEREINEFIVYWIDKLENNKYNLISFRNSKDINESMPLEFSSEVDTLIRVIMDYRPLNRKIEVKEQKLTKVERSGFTVVEWGGKKH